MIMQIVRDIVMWALPDEGRAKVECYTGAGASFLHKHWNTLSGVSVEADDINEFMDKAREEGCSCTLKLA